MHRFVYRAVAAATAAGATVLLALSAAPAAGAAVVNTHYSQFLSGYVVEGNGLQPYSNIRAHPVALPDESDLITPVPANTIAIGVALGQNLSTGGHVYGLAAVWDDPSDTVNGIGCNADQWVIEDGSFTSVASPEPVPVVDLFAVNSFGAPICINPGGGQWLELNYSTLHHQVNAIVGPSESNDNVVDIFHGVFGSFRAPAVGLTATSGADAATLKTGTLANFGGEGVGLTKIVSNMVGAHQFRVTFTAQNLGRYVGTENGGAPSVANPQTLTPTGFGTGSRFQILVP
jgi:hypothetical protein